MTRALLAAGLLLAAFALPVVAKPIDMASISINESGPYAVGDVITLTVDTGQLKGYEYPVVIIRCYSTATNDLVWTYFARWDGLGQDPDSGPTPVLLGGDPNNTSILWNSVGGDADCTLYLYAYHGLHPGPAVLLATGPTIHVTAP